MADDDEKSTGTAVVDQAPSGGSNDGGDDRNSDSGADQKKDEKKSGGKMRPIILGQQANGVTVFDMFSNAYEKDNSAGKRQVGPKSIVTIVGSGLDKFDKAVGKVILRIGGQRVNAVNVSSSSRAITFFIPKLDKLFSGKFEIFVELHGQSESGILNNANGSAFLKFSKSEDEEEEKKKGKGKGGHEKKGGHAGEGAAGGGLTKLFLGSTGEVLSSVVKPFMPKAALTSNNRRSLNEEIQKTDSSKEEIHKAIKEAIRLGDTQGLQNALKLAKAKGDTDSIDAINEALKPADEAKFEPEFAEGTTEESLEKKENQYEAEDRNIGEKSEVASSESNQIPLEIAAGGLVGFIETSSALVAPPEVKAEVIDALKRSDYSKLSGPAKSFLDHAVVVASTTETGTSNPFLKLAAGTIASHLVSISNIPNISIDDFKKASIPVSKYLREHGLDFIKDESVKNKILEALESGNVSNLSPEEQGLLQMALFGSSLGLSEDELDSELQAAIDTVSTHVGQIGSIEPSQEESEDLYGWSSRELLRRYLSGDGSSLPFSKEVLIALESGNFANLSPEARIFLLGKEGEKIFDLAGLSPLQMESIRAGVKTFAGAEEPNLSNATELIITYLRKEGSRHALSKEILVALESGSFVGLSAEARASLLGTEGQTIFALAGLSPVQADSIRTAITVSLQTGGGSAELEGSARSGGGRVTGNLSGTLEAKTSGPSSSQKESREKGKSALADYIDDNPDLIADIKTRSEVSNELRNGNAAGSNLSPQARVALRSVITLTAKGGLPEQPPSPDAKAEAEDLKSQADASEGSEFKQSLAGSGPAKLQSQLQQGEKDRPAKLSVSIDGQAGEGQEEGAEVEAAAGSSGGKGKPKPGPGSGKAKGGGASPEGGVEISISQKRKTGGEKQGGAGESSGEEGKDEGQKKSGEIDLAVKDEGDESEPDDEEEEGPSSGKGKASEPPAIGKGNVDGVEPKSKDSDRPQKPVGLDAMKQRDADLNNRLGDEISPPPLDSVEPQPQSEEENPPVDDKDTPGGHIPGSPLNLASSQELPPKPQVSGRPDVSAPAHEQSDVKGGIKPPLQMGEQPEKDEEAEGGTQEGGPAEGPSEGEGPTETAVEGGTEAGATAATEGAAAGIAEGAEAGSALGPEGALAGAAAGAAANSEATLKEAVALINPYINGVLIDVCLGVWATALPTFGFTAILGAIVGDFLWAFKKALIKRAINSVLISKIIVGKEFDADEIAKEVKFSAGVKANIAAMNAVLLALIVGAFLFFGIVLYAGCSWPTGATISSATNYELTIIGRMGYIDVCKSFMSSTGSFSDKLNGSLTGPPTLGGVVGSTCKAMVSGPASTAVMTDSCFGQAHGAEASAIAFQESGGDPLRESGSDKCAGDGKVFSVGLFQINLLVHNLVDSSGQTLQCMSAFTKNNPYVKHDSSGKVYYDCSVSNIPLYNQCVTAAKDADNNIKAACQISSNGAHWGPWSTNATCGFTN